MFRITLLSTLFILACQVCAFSQSYSLQLHITNQPDNPIVFGWISGDDFHKIDSASVFNQKVEFDFPEAAHPGVYRLIFGKTGYARVMNEDPQTLDFIFNNENIELQTDFKKPVEALRVIRSAENELYFDFLTRQNEYEKALSLMEQEIDRYWETNDTANASALANEFNQIQLDWDSRTEEIVTKNSNLLAAKLIAMKRQPLKDGFLLPTERTENFKKHYFDSLDFSDEELIFSAAYTDKVFNFLLLFNAPDFSRDQRVTNYVAASDQILAHTAESPKVHDFIKNYLIHGFRVLQMDELIKHIKQHP